MTVRILATASRSYREFSTMRSTLTTVHERHPDALLMHGDAEDGDRDAAGIWRCAPDCRPGHRRRRRNGDWFCPTAGLRRNVTMVETAEGLVLVLAFCDPTSKTKGAFHCANLAVAAGIPTLIYREGVAGVEAHNLAEVPA